MLELAENRNWNDNNFEYASLPFSPFHYQLTYDSNSFMTKMMGTGGFHLIDVYITNSI
jgi:hypothetical protein